MSAPSVKKKEPAGEVAAVNEVRLVGRVSQAPEERVLPSGDALWTFRLVVPRAGSRSRSQAVGSSVAQGPDEHADVGLGLERGGLLRQQTVSRDDAQHQVEVGRGQQDGHAG